MTSLSKGILKKRGADPVPYSEASLEFFEPPEKKTAAEPVLPHDIRMNCFPSSFSKYLVFKNLIPVPKTPLGSY